MKRLSILLFACCLCLSGMATGDPKFDLVPVSALSTESQAIVAKSAIVPVGIDQKMVDNLKLMEVRPGVFLVDGAIYKGEELVKLLNLNAKALLICSGCYLDSSNHWFCFYGGASLCFARAGCTCN